MNNLHTAKEINIKEWLLVLKQRWLTILIVTVVIATAGVLYSSRPAVPLYQVSARMIVHSDTDTFNTIRVLLKEPIVLEKVSGELKLNRSVNGLRNQVFTSNVDGTQVALVSVVDPDPRVAAAIANETVEQLKQAARELLNFTGITVLSDANGSGSQEPINPQNQIRNNILSIMIGLVFGIGAALLRNSLDDTIRLEHRAKDLAGVPILGTVTRIKAKPLTKKAKQLTSGISVRGETVGS
ncbi:YveK family protein [Paenibacillus spongiae]|uniref:Wzz/FepE/Etk N-terminal domain-containing protein n=1 Tax=Paenibacillus spongiae TaxID=2909671 RepID=A0ABY5SFS2_9BACL|nr:Wzz/FepE/Etk N-terminal domain-containing protein [Paenibacillus spongiae]UVI31518.1 Wzz/FepE/Etk N-terminal domain-containing protein [Paenibacillus spongiae]